MILFQIYLSVNYRNHNILIYVYCLLDGNFSLAKQKNQIFFYSNMKQQQITKQYIDIHKKKAIFQHEKNNFRNKQNVIKYLIKK